jgi:hypothetical protein
VLCDCCVGGQAAGAVDGFIDVRDRPVPPTAHFVAEDPETPCEATTDCTLGDGTSSCRIALRDGRNLDHEATCRDGDDKRRVIESERRAPLHPRDHRLVDATVESHGMATGAERDPVQVDPDSVLDVQLVLGFAQVLSGFGVAVFNGEIFTTRYVTPAERARIEQT